MSATSVSSISSSLTSAAGTPSNGGASSAQEQQDRFLKLLVAQLNNQDPLHPLDNAQMTTQIAQINTVGGIEKVNQTLKGIADQFGAMQVLQGSSLLGHDVLIESNQMSNADGKATGVVDLADAADSVKVDILTPGGQVLDSFDLGPQAQGRHHFNWDSSKYTGTGAPQFRVAATQGTVAVAATLLGQDKVISVGSVGGQLSIQLQNRGNVTYGNVKAIL